MSTMITVRDIDPGDKRWLKAEARRLGVSMEELVRRAIREKRKGAKSGPKEEKPSEIIRRLFGPEHGVDLPRPRLGMRPVDIDFE
jgi:plasmid stability protein